MNTEAETTSMQQYQQLKWMTSCNTGSYSTDGNLLQPALVVCMHDSNVQML